MPVRYANMMPDVRSRLLCFYEQHASHRWSNIGLGTLERPVPPVLARFRPDELPAKLAQWQHGVVREAGLFFVDDTFVELAVHAAASLPQFGVHRHLLPAPQGLLCWSTPVATREQSRFGTVGTIGVAWSALATGVWLWLFDDLDDCRAPFTGHTPPPWMDGWLCDWEGLFLPWHESLRFTDTHLNKPFELGVLATVATWLLMGQTLTVHTTQPTPRRLARALAQRDHPTSDVTYIALRPPERDRATTADRGSAEAREYHHQWVVTGHWRNQFYPSVGEHRPIWIAPYVKGPDGAPVLHAEKVYTLRR